jgi:hypothetical protein
MQQTWALLTARQASVLEQLIAELGERSVPGQARAQASLPSPRMRADGPAESHEIDPFEVEPLDSPFQSAETFVVPSTAIPRANAVELTGLGIEVAGTAGDDSWRVRAGGDFVESGGASLPPDVMERLIRERAECDRHREEARTLRSELEGLRAEVQRLRPLAEKLKRIRAERDRLRVERDQRRREAEESRARLVELQLTLVEAEAELDDCRARARLAWERRRQGRVDEAESLLVEYEESSQFEFELEAWSEQITIASKSLDSEGTDLPRA